jgi:hypothetical protein
MNTLPTNSSTPGKPHQRKIHYIDHVLQKWLLIALVVLEAVVLSVAGVILYIRLNDIIEESLYRIHFAGQTSMLSALLTESLLIIGGLVAVNLVALFAADRIWSHYVKGILLTLRDLLSNTRELNLRADVVDVPQRHKVLTLALSWRLAERERHLALNESLNVVESVASRTSASDGEFRDSLLSLRAHLPDGGLENSRPAL